MSKKTLLNEASVRRFMKLADMQGLSDNFLNEMYGDKAYQEDEPEEAMDDEMPELDDEMTGDEMADDEMAGDEGPDEAPEPEMPEMDDEMGEEADEVEITEDDRDILAKAADILSKIAGGGGADAGMDDMGDVGMEGEAGMRDMDDMGDVGMEDELLDEVQIVDENKLVQEVTRRVAERLRKAIKSRK